MKLWSQWCQEIYEDPYSWSFVKCCVVFGVGVIIIRSLDSKFTQPSLV
ncbi:hypothetical protein KR018_007189 [Drosophila ironensis]|nr:hypothetical protein KR018_007189 [Drosophila ironensis]